MSCSCPRDVLALSDGCLVPAPWMSCSCPIAVAFLSYGCVLPVPWVSCSRSMGVLLLSHGCPSRTMDVWFLSHEWLVPVSWMSRSCPLHVSFLYWQGGKAVQLCWALCCPPLISHGGQHRLDKNKTSMGQEQAIHETRTRHQWGTNKPLTDKKNTSMG